MTWAAETPGASARSRRGMPSAAAGSAIIRASWPPPTTATTGPDPCGTSYDVRDSPGLTRRSVGAAVSRGSGGTSLRRRRRAQGVGGARSLGLEPEAVAPDGGDQRGLARVVTQLAADPTEVDVDGLRRRP